MSARELVALSMAALVVVYLIKATYLGMLAWWQAKFAFAVQTNVSERLFIGYVLQPWPFHLERNSAELLRNVTTEVTNLNNVVQAVIAIVTESCVVTAIGLLLLAVEPLGSAVVIVMLGTAALSFHHLTNTKLVRWGEARQRHDGLRIQHVQQGLGGVKDVKLLGREEEFLSQYRVHNLGMAHVGERQFALQQLPRLWLELLAVVGLALLVLVMMGRGRSLEALLPTLGLFAAAAFRLMPSVVRIMNSLQVVRYYAPSVVTVDDELQLGGTLAPGSRHGPLPLRQSIDLAHVTFQYPTASSAAVEPARARWWTSCWGC
jgi:ABC-type multidrug transport system fused ATPase/permease subunit